MSVIAIFLPISCLSLCYLIPDYFVHCLVSFFFCPVPGLSHFLDHLLAKSITSDCLIYCVVLFSVFSLVLFYLFQHCIPFIHLLICIFVPMAFVYEFDRGV